jgi:NAD dependent epimerase/dehydratase family enzyme
VPFGLPATRAMLELGAFFLRTDTELLLKSRRVVSGLLASDGFVFDFPQWAGASEDLVRAWRTARRGSAGRRLGA